ncbi:MAG: CehA/McbA family metallohydrolase [Hungatella sp.]|nr:CehA/McbA family metallohydrolase [Hungatella sp.]
MKIDKYGEILGEWSRGMGKELDVKRVLALDSRLKNSETDERLIVYIQVKDVEEKPLLAEIRCYSLPAGSWCGKLDGTDERIDEAYSVGNLDFIRTVTDETGYGVLFLEPGWYQIEASKGSAYSVEAVRLHLEESQTILRYGLKPFEREAKAGWYAGDIHHHSVFSSRLYEGTDPVIETPVQIRDSMRAAGLDFGALSDHHNVLDHELWEKTRTEDFIPVLSKEISTGNGHVISLNVKKNEDVIYRIGTPEERTDEYLRNEFCRVTDQIRQKGGLAQLNHPRDPQKAISWNPDFMDIITIFDTMEIWNGSKPMVHGSSSAKAVEMWIDMLENGVYLPGTTGSDTHNIRCDDYKAFYRDTLRLVKTLKTLKAEDPLLRDKNIACFLEDSQKVLPAFEKWAKRNLSSGGVRTFVHMDSFESGDDLIKQMKKGHMVLSDGPLFFPVMERVSSSEDSRGASPAFPGDRVSAPGDIQVKLYTNRRLKTIRLLKKGRRMADYSLAPYEKERGGYMDYSHRLTREMLKDMGMEWKKEDYLVMIAFDDCTNLAIANPFFVIESAD